jgi:hypothetical protein
MQITYVQHTSETNIREPPMEHQENVNATKKLPVATLEKKSC